MGIRSLVRGLVMALLLPAGMASAQVEPVDRKAEFGTVSRLVFMPEGEQFLICCGSTLRIIDVKSGEIGLQSPGSSRYRDLAITRDGSQLIFPSGSKVYVMNANNGQAPAMELEEKPSASVVSLCLDPKQRWLWLGLKDGTLMRVMMEGDRVVKKAEVHADGIVKIATDDKGAAVAVFDAAHGLSTWKTSSLKELKRWEGPQTDISAMQFQPKGKLLATAGMDGSVVLWDVAKGVAGKQLAGHDKPVLALAFDSKGKRLVTGSEDGRVVLWDVAKGKQLGHFSGTDGKPEALAFSPKGKEIWAGGFGSGVTLWEIKSLEK